MLNISITYNVGKINKKNFKKSIAMYNIILYNNYSNKIQIKGDLQMLSLVNEIKKETEKGLIGIYVDICPTRVSLHYQREEFLSKFKISRFVPRASHNEEYPWEAVADLGDGSIAFCLFTEEMKIKWNKGEL